MTGDRRTLVWIGAGLVLALLLGIGGGWLARGGEVGKLEEKVSELESQGLESDAETDTAEVAPTIEQSGSGAGQAPLTASSQPATAAEVTAGPTEVQPGYVVSVADVGGTWKLQIDYIQFLTGADAAAAATAHGDESPPPNDYYVVNDNPKIREFPVQAGIGVIVVTNTDGTWDPSGHAMSLSEWTSAMSGPYADAFKSCIYWVTVNNGTITGIEAQYVP